MNTESLKIKLFENIKQEILEFSLENAMGISIYSENQDVIDTIIKTVFADAEMNDKSYMIKFLVLTYRPTFYKKLEYSKFRNRIPVSTAKKIIKLLESVNDIIDDRYQKLKIEAGWHTIVDYNREKIHEDKRDKIMSYLILLMETPIITDDEQKKRIDRLMLKITHRARAVGIIVIVFTTKPSFAFSITNKYFLPNRISFGFSDINDSISLLHNDQACSLKEDEWSYTKLEYGDIGK